MSAASLSHNEERLCKRKHKNNEYFYYVIRIVTIVVMMETGTISMANAMMAVRRLLPHH